MKAARPVKILRRGLLAVLAAVLAAGLAAPRLRANRLRPQIQAALEAALKRPVRIVKDVHLNLFTGPGFTVEGVLIDDDPAAGIEPFANVESLRARLSLSSLWRGKLVFSSLYLDSPSVNLVKMPSGAWNFETLLSHGAAGNRNSASRLEVPDLQISGGRLNFKFGDTKSVFYVSSADVDVYPNEQGDVIIRFTGEPARTDRGSQSFGEMSARGILRAGSVEAGSNEEARLTMGLRLERTAISELVRLFNGRDFGMHGFLVADAQLDGPLSKLAISGNVNINDIHRWDLMPAKGDGWTLHYRGALNLPGHSLDLETVPTPGQPQPVSVNLRLMDYLAAAKWTAGVAFQDLPAASLVETARHMGAPLPAGIQVDASVNGSVGYSSEYGPSGEVSFEKATVKFPNAGAAGFESARLSIGNNAIVLAPVAMSSDSGASAEIEGEYALDNSRAALKISTRQFTAARIQSNAETVGATSIPLLDVLRQGAWKGWIAFERVGEGAGVWSGDYDLQNAVLDVPGLASPVRFQSAAVRMNDGQIQISRIHARVGGMRVEGDYRYDRDARRPHHLRIASPEVKLPDLERLMLPTLRHDEDGFFARTFRLRSAPLPKWLEERRVDAAFDVRSVLIGDASLGAVRAHLLWDGPSLVFSDIDCHLERMSAAGALTLSLSQANPSYKLTGSVANLDYRNGQLDVDGELETKGIGEDLLSNIRSEGTFEGRGVALNSDTLIREIAGSYRLAPFAGFPRLQLTNVQAQQGADALSGQGASQPDGRLVLELSTGHRQVRLTGMLLPIHLDPLAGR